MAEEDGKVVGYVEGIIEKRSSKLKNRKVGILESLYIRPGYRGKGLGEVLSKKLLKWFKSKGINSFELTVHHANAKAYKLYKKLGFKDYFWSMKT